MMNSLDWSRPAHEVARDLIGRKLYSYLPHKTGGIIIETEAYSAFDEASHSYKGKTLRNKAMFMKPGTLYLYRIYGMHTCLNLVTGARDGQAVLIRMLEPTHGFSTMQSRRSTTNIHLLCNGPANIVQALGLSMELNTVHITKSPLVISAEKKHFSVEALPRIGIRKAVEMLWRFKAS